MSFGGFGLRDEKPVVIASGWVNASGGMLMSMGANEIYAEGGSVVGSIGVVGVLPQPESVGEDVITTGPAKATGGSQQYHTGGVELLKEAFVQTVITERGDRLRISAEELSEAQIYYGLRAVSVGLIDAIGSDTDAVERAAELAGISRYEIVDINEKVLREFVLKAERIFASTDGEERQFQFSDISRMRRVASAARGTEGGSGLPPEYPVEKSLPRTYYLYVTPTE